MIKKLLQITMAILFAMPLFGYGQTIKLEAAAGSDFSTPGEVTISIKFEDMPATICAAQFVINYPQGLMVYQSASNLPPGLFDVNQSYQENQLFIAYAGSDVPNGVFVDLNFIYYGGFDVEMSFEQSTVILTRCDDDSEIEVQQFVPLVEPWTNDIDNHGQSTIGEVTASALQQVVDVPVSLTNYGDYDDICEISLRVAYDTQRLAYFGYDDPQTMDFEVGHIQNDGLITINLEHDIFFNGAITWNEGTPVINLKFTYLDFGDAFVNFLPGSFLNECESMMLTPDLLVSTDFTNGKVSYSEDPKGTLTIETLGSVPACEDDDLGIPYLVPVSQQVAITASGFDQNVEYSSVKLFISYDTDNLEYQSFEDGSIAGWVYLPDGDKLTFFKDDFVTPQPIANDVILKLNFDVISQVPVFADITFDLATELLDHENALVFIEMVDGGIEIQDIDCPVDFEVCFSDAAFSLARYVSPEGGVFSGDGVSNGEFDPDVAGAGDHIITYTIAYVDGCNYECTFTITVNALPDAPTADDLTVCYDGTEHSAGANAPPGLSVVWYTTEDGTEHATAPTGTATGTYTAWAASKDDDTGCESVRVEVTLTIEACYFELKVFLEGFYRIADEQMIKVQDENGDKWGGTITDKITVEFHEKDNYGTASYTYSDVELDQDGTALIFLDQGKPDGEFYITVKHRNHLETVSKLPFDFNNPAKSTFEYDFTTAADKAFGDNQKEFDLGGGNLVYAIFAGDVDQDGILTGADLVDITDGVRSGATGYLDIDCDGDGILTGADLVITTDNVRAGVEKKVPPSSK